MEKQHTQTQTCTPSEVETGSRSPVICNSMFSVLRDLQHTFKNVFLSFRENKPKKARRGKWHQMLKLEQQALCKSLSLPEGKTPIIGASALDIIRNAGHAGAN